MSDDSMNEQKQGLVPRLRFPEFREVGEWESALVQGLVSTVTPPKKLTSGLYESEGRFPVIDQSQAYICGWTNDEDALVSVDSPLIIFGDHTCVLKIVDQSFVQGADGIKILKSNELISPLFLYQYLLCFPVSMESYKRHYSTLKEKLVLYPERKSGEQQKIADCLSSLDALIAAQADKLDALKTHKKGLMQQLFPREGETVPRLRFPEFREAEEWNRFTFGAAARFVNGRAYKQDELLENGKYRVLRVGNFFSNNNWYYSDLELEEDKYCNDGDLLYAWSASFGPRIWRGEKVIYHYHIWKVEEKSGVNRDFLFLLLGYETERMKSKSANGLGLLHITKGTIESWECTLPGPKEQQKIASCLSSLDALITAQADKLDALKTHKQGLMQQLFPSPEAVAA